MASYQARNDASSANAARNSSAIPTPVALAVIPVPSPVPGRSAYHVSRSRKRNAVDGEQRPTAIPRLARLTQDEPAAEAATTATMPGSGLGDPYASPSHQRHSAQRRDRVAPVAATRRLGRRDALRRH